MINTSNNNRGFTLIEMLVSLSIFTMVVTMSVGTLLILIDANGRAQSMQLVMTNITFALDSMTREIRTGFNWSCGTSASAPSVPIGTSDCADGNYLSIIETGNSLTYGLSSNRVSYWFDDDYYGANHGAILRKLGTTVADGDWLPLTAKEIILEDVNLVVYGTERFTDTPLNPNLVQPTATIYIKGRSGTTDANTKEFSLQTTITQRLLDI